MSESEQLLRQWRQVRERMAALAARAEQAVTLIAVSKTFPVADIRTLYQAGQRDFGENYIQEWQDKQAALDNADIIWHIIGHIQSNKSRAVAEHAHWVHTVDREKIARRLNDQRPPHLPPLNVCIEVNIANEAQKHGIAPTAVLPLAQTVAQLPRLRLRGLMCVARADSTPQALTQQFTTMQQLLCQLQTAGLDADVLSMGMSADMDAAIACGATHVRVGSAIFGHRAAKTQTDKNKKENI